MILDNLRLLTSLYRRPARAMGRILDEGSLLFGALVVLLTGAVLAASTFLPMWASLESSVQDAAAMRQAAGKHAEPRSGPEAAPGGPESLDEALATSGRERGPLATWVDAFFGTLASSVLVSLAALALLYVPACLLVASLLAPVGSFGLV